MSVGTAPVTARTTTIRPTYTTTTRRYIPTPPIPTVEQGLGHAHINSGYRIDPLGYDYLNLVAIPNAFPVGGTICGKLLVGENVIDRHGKNINGSVISAFLTSKQTEFFHPETRTHLNPQLGFNLDVAILQRGRTFMGIVPITSPKPEWTMIMGVQFQSNNLHITAMPIPPIPRFENQVSPLTYDVSTTVAMIDCGHHPTFETLHNYGLSRDEVHIAMPQGCEWSESVTWRFGPLATFIDRFKYQLKTTRHFSGYPTRKAQFISDPITLENKMVTIYNGVYSGAVGAIHTIDAPSVTIEGTQPVIDILSFPNKNSSQVAYIMGEFITETPTYQACVTTLNTNHPVLDMTNCLATSAFPGFPDKITRFDPQNKRMAVEYFTTPWHVFGNITSDKTHSGIRWFELGGNSTHLDLKNARVINEFEGYFEPVFHNPKFPGYYTTILKHPDSTLTTTATHILYSENNINMTQFDNPIFSWRRMLTGPPELRRSELPPKAIPIFAPSQIETTTEPTTQPSTQQTTLSTSKGTTSTTATTPSPSTTSTTTTTTTTTSTTATTSTTTTSTKSITQSPSTLTETSTTTKEPTSTSTTSAPLTSTKALQTEETSNADIDAQESTKDSTAGGFEMPAWIWVVGAIALLLLGLGLLVCCWNSRCRYTHNKTTTDNTTLNRNETDHMARSAPYTASNHTILDPEALLREQAFIDIIKESNQDIADAIQTMVDNGSGPEEIRLEVAAFRKARQSGNLQSHIAKQIALNEFLNFTEVPVTNDQIVNRGALAKQFENAAKDPEKNNILKPHILSEYLPEVRNLLTNPQLPKLSRKQEGKIVHSILTKALLGDTKHTNIKHTPLPQPPSLRASKKIAWEESKVINPLFVNSSPNKNTQSPEKNKKEYHDYLDVQDQPTPTHDYEYVENNTIRTTTGGVKKASPSKSELSTKLDFSNFPRGQSITDPDTHNYDNVTSNTIELTKKILRKEDGVHLTRPLYDQAGAFPIYNIANSNHQTIGTLQRISKIDSPNASQKNSAVTYELGTFKTPLPFHSAQRSADATKDTAYIITNDNTATITSKKPNTQSCGTLPGQMETMPEHRYEEPTPISSFLDPDHDYETPMVSLDLNDPEYEEIKNLTLIADGKKILPEHAYEEVLAIINGLKLHRLNAMRKKSGNTESTSQTHTNETKETAAIYEFAQNTESGTTTSITVSDANTHTPIAKISRLNGDDNLKITLLKENSSLPIYILGSSNNEYTLSTSNPYELGTSVPSPTDHTYHFADTEENLTWTLKKNGASTIYDLGDPSIKQPSETPYDLSSSSVTDNHTVHSKDLSYDTVDITPLENPYDTVNNVKIYDTADNINIENPYSFADIYNNLDDLRQMLSDIKEENA